MADQLEALAGIAGSGKTASLLQIYRDALKHARQAHAPGNALWLAPTSHTRAAIREQLLDDALPVAFGPHVLTFKEFADHLLAAASEPVEPLTPAGQRILLRRIVAQLTAARKLRYFAGIADTSGFLDVLLSFIAELKRGETWPDDFEKVCLAAGARPRDRELALIYRTYQDCLLRHRLYDGEGRFWSAREVLRQGHWGRFDSLSLVVVDGFSDFTRTQYEILQLLARHAGRMIVSLPLESSARRRDLFAKPAEALERIQKAVPTQIQSVASPDREKGGGRSAAALQPPAAFSHVARWLFANPREVPLCRDGTGIEILEVAGQAGEVNLLAARVKALLLHGVPAEKIVVGIRDLADYSDLIGETFTAAGIPFHCDFRAPLSRVPLLKAALNLLQLEVEDWPFRRLMSLLDSSFFRPNWPELDRGQAIRNVAAVLRSLHIDGGRESILSQLRLVARAEPAADRAEDAGAERLRRQAQRAGQLLHRLSQAAAPLREPHSLRHWAETLDAVVRELLLPAAAAGTESADDAIAAADRAAWSTLKDLLFGAARVEPLLGEGIQTQLTLAEFAHELTDLLTVQTMSSSRPAAGSVRVMEAADVRNLDIPHLFLAGLTERSFPHSRSDDCIYSEHERRALSEQGLWLGHRAARTQEEMLLFYNIVTRAREQLVLSYPVVSADGAPLSPSPYLTALRELFADKALKTDFDEQLEPIPRDGRILSPADARIRGLHDALEQRPALFGALCAHPESKSTAFNILAAIEMNVQRFHTPGFTPFDGRLQSVQNIEQLHRRFDARHEFSATQLEAYGECPFRFFLSHVLKVEPLAETEVETDFGSRGTLVHALLADLHREFFDPSVPRADLPELPTAESVMSRFHELLSDRLGRQPERSELHQALLHIEDRLLREWGEAFAEQWSAYFASLPALRDAPLRPAGFEVAFGTPTHGSETTATAPLSFGAGDSQVLVGGRIDRIDVGRDGDETVYSVIDYKTGRRKTHRLEDLQAGRVLQLALYGLAVQRLDLAGPEARLFQLGYWHIRETGFAPGMKVKKQKGVDTLPPIEEATWVALVQTLEEVVPRLAGGIRNGRFDVFNEDDNCQSFCPYATVCRVGQIRALPDQLQKRP